MRNSPLQNAKAITTPLLSWAGNRDHNVNWEQSVTFYLALRRLGKQHILLLYPEEGHSVFMEKNQTDLSNRVREWFDYFLKGISADWVTKGIE